MVDLAFPANRAGLRAALPVQVERLAWPPAAAVVGSWAQLAEAAYRLHIARAVLDQLTSSPRPDAPVIALAYEELHLAQERHLDLAGRWAS